MEADWDEVSRAAVPVPGPHMLPTVASTVAFDDEQELLWTGNEYVSLLAGGPVVFKLLFLSTLLLMPYILCGIRRAE